MAKSKPNGNSWQDVIVKLAEVLPKVRTPAQLVGFVMLVVAIFLCFRVTKVHDVALATAVGLVAAAFLAVGLSHHVIRDIPASKRAGFLVTMALLVLLAMLGAIGIGVYLVLQMSSTTVALTLESGDIPLTEDFDVFYTVPGWNQFSGHGSGGIFSILGVPRTVKAIDIDKVICKGYAPKTLGSFAIADGKIGIAMIESGPREPDDGNPDPSPFMPPKEIVDRPGKVVPEKVTFCFLNTTGDDLRLLLYRCSSFYQPQPQSISDIERDGATTWINWPFPASDTEKKFAGFHGGTGWFLLFVKTKSGESHFLRCENLFESRKPKVTVFKEDGMYKARFVNEEPQRKGIT